MSTDTQLDLFNASSGRAEADDVEVVLWLATSSTGPPRELDGWGSPARTDAEGRLWYGLRRETLARLAECYPSAEVAECLLALAVCWGTPAHPERRDRRPPTYAHVWEAVVDALGEADEGTTHQHDKLQAERQLNLLWRAAAAA